MSNDLATALGQVMGEVMRLGGQVTLLRTDVQTLTTELGGMRRDIELDRTALVRGASRRAAARSSNRMAALIGMLYLLAEHVWPFVNAFWKVHR